MNIQATRSFLGVLLGFAGVFFLFAKRKKQPLTDDAEVLLQQATQEMKEAQAKNREKAVRAITQKNMLQAHLDYTQKMVDNLRSKAIKAHEEGDFALESQLKVEQERYERSLQQMAIGLQTAIEATETIKTAMRREEERIRTDVARALAMTTQYKAVQIGFAIEQSLLTMTTTTATELFTRAQTKIQQTQARRDLMAQIRKTVETLETAAEKAAANGDPELRARLRQESDKLKERALNPKLW